MSHREVQGPRRTLEGNAPLVVFARDLQKLRPAGLTLKALAQKTNFATATLSKVTSGRELSSRAALVAYVEGLGHNAAPWVERWEQLCQMTPAERLRPPEGSTGEEVLAAGSNGGDPGARVMPSKPPHEPDVPPTRGGRLRERRWWWAAAAGGIGLTAIAGLLAINPPPGKPKTSALSDCSDKTSEHLVVTVSPDISTVLQSLARDYGSRTAAGQCVYVNVKAMGSGLAMTTLRRGWQEKDDGDAPDVWSPASQIWLPLARQNATPATTTRLPEKPTSLIATSPLVIAMPEPMAKALGWPTARIGWSDLADFAAKAKTLWAEHKHSEWGPFLLGKPDPRYSTSGLNATVAAYFAATRTSGELVTGNIDSPANQEFERTIERAVIRYDAPLTFMANLRRANDSPPTPADPVPALSYISAVTVDESNVVAYNAGYTCGTYSDQAGCTQADRPSTKLAAFYPKDGMLFSDHPYIEMNNLSPAKKAVADDFLTYLHSASATKQFTKIGLRDNQNRLTDQITQENGALPDAPMDSLPLPRPPVLDRILTVWPSLRKSANVLLVLDTSGSMGQQVAGDGRTKLRILQDAAPTLLDAFTDTDRVGLWQFSTAGGLRSTANYRSLVPSGPVGDKIGTQIRREALTENINNLHPNGDSALYDTTAAAVATVRAGYDPNAMNAVILLTDGSNDPDGTGPRPVFDGQPLIDQLKDPSQNPVRVFTIAYGSHTDADDVNGRNALKKIAEATGGRSYDAEYPTTILKVITNLVSNF